MTRGELRVVLHRSNSPVCGCGWKSSHPTFRSEFKQPSTGHWSTNLFLGGGGGSPLMREMTLTKAGKFGLLVHEDLIALAAGGSAIWLRVNSIQRMFALDILEFILSNYVVVFKTLVSYEQVMRYQIWSLLMTSLRTNFKLEGEAGEPIFCRLVLRSVARIIRLYSSSHINECEVFLSMLVKVTSLDLPLWHRILVLEILRGFCVEARTLGILFQNFDMNYQEIGKIN